MHFFIMKYQTIVPNDDRAKLGNTTIANKIQEWAASLSVDSTAAICCLEKRSTSSPV